MFNKINKYGLMVTLKKIKTGFFHDECQNYDNLAL